MRTLLFTLIISAILVGCKSNDKPKANPTRLKEQEPQELTVTEEVVNHISLKGSWLSKNYAEALLGNLSPYRCSAQYQNITELRIGDDQVSLVYANAEGFQSTISKNTEQMVLLESGMTLSIDGQELVTKNDGNIQRMIRVESPPKPQSILNHFVMARLFAGTYQSKNGKVKIDVNGKVKGFEDFTQLRVFTRFDELADFDVVALINPADETQYAGWKIENGVIVLYRLVRGTDYLYQKDQEWLRLALIEAVG